MEKNVNKAIKNPNGTTTPASFPALYLFLSVFVILLINNSCVTPIDLETKEASEKLVVEGWITDQPGPYEVRLTLTAKYGTGHENINTWIQGAKVSVIDGQGKEVFFEEKGLGFYYTKKEEIQGRVGNTYKIRINIGEKTYESKSETIIKAPEINRAYSEYRDSTIFYDDGFYTYVDFKDRGDQENYYRWNWIRYQERYDCGVVPMDYYVPHWRGKTRICCSYCYDVRECYNCLNIQSDQYFQGQNIVGRLVTVYPYDGRQSVAIKIFQQSISKEAYTYLNSVFQQNKNSGNVFDTPPFPIRGNISNINDPNEDVLGFFGAAGEAISFVLIKRTEVIKPPLANYDFERPRCGSGNCSNDPALPPSCCPSCGECLEEDGRTPNVPEDVRILLRD